MKFKDLSIRTKLLILGIGLPLILVSVLFGLYFWEASEKATDAYVDKARSICLTTEAVREQMDDNWAKGIYTLDMLKQWEAAGQKEKVLGAVPVVMAWRSAAKKAHEGNYTFRTPKFSPRNPLNEPDELEAKALKAFESDSSLTEYQIIDHTKNAEGNDNNSVRYFRPVKLTETCLACHGDPAKSKDYWGNSEGKDITGARMEGWKVGEVHGAFEVIQSLQPAQESLWKSTGIAAGIVLLGLIVLCAIFMVFAGSISAALKKTVDVFHAMAKGDLTGRIILDQKDEIGLLAEAANETAVGLQKIIRELTESSTVLSHSSDELTTTSNMMASSAEEMNAQAATVSAAGEELSVNVNSMSKTADKMSGAARNVASAIEEMNASINEVARNCSKESDIAVKANEKAQQTRKVISELGEAAREIGRVVEIIGKIADQTNLLALNATIEAASAGEAGRGFAVVANEVKELARQCAQATEQISSQISSIQQKSEASVHSTEEVSTIIEEVSQIARTIAAAVEEQSATTNEITRNMAGVSTGSSELARNIQESATGSNQVSQNIQGVGEAAQQAAAAATETNASAQELSKMAERLKKIVAQFKV